MGEMVAGVGFRPAVRARVSLDAPYGALLRELEQVWTEIGEREEDRDRMILALEEECMQVYRRKVDEACSERSRLHQSLVQKEAELAALMATLGEPTIQKPVEKVPKSLKVQLASVNPLLQGLRAKKEDRLRQFSEVRAQIDKIQRDITGSDLKDGSRLPDKDEFDLSLRRLSEYQTQLRALQKEKSDRLEKVLKCVNEVHSLCGILGINFVETVNDVHPTLHEAGAGKSANITDNTLEGLGHTILKLKEEKKVRLQKLRETVKSLLKLLDLMESTENERMQFAKVVSICRTADEDITSPGLLTIATIEQTEAEVERLTKLKASRMKQIVLKRRSELEEICKSVHVEPDTSTAPDKMVALIDSGLVDALELLASIEAQIGKVRQESLVRKEILDRVNKWLAACDEENWLEEYNLDDNRYSAGRGVHLNLKRAEKARILVHKIPDMIENLMNRIFSWEAERGMPFLYDGVRLASILEEYKLSRLRKEEEKRIYRDQKKLQNLLLTEKELTYGSKPSPRKTASFSKKPSANRPNSNISGFMTPMPRRASAGGGATPELLTPRSYSGRSNGFFRETRRMSAAAPLNFSSAYKEDSVSSFASISGSEPESPLYMP